jgi:hypothetical protein
MSQTCAKPLYESAVKEYRYLLQRHRMVETKVNGLHFALLDCVLHCNISNRSRITAVQILLEAIEDELKALTRLRVARL